ncbi:MAG: hypothetical protein IJ604_00830 [Prevotella sp.]|nr:hypothetical protein [Prevotella sp.]
MKKKIFSSLLLVAVAIASTSMFVSCKDYDDDINKNANAISALQTTIDQLKGQLDQTYLKIADAQAKYATLADTYTRSQLYTKDEADKAFAKKALENQFENWTKGVADAQTLKDLIDKLQKFNDENQGGYLKADDQRFLDLVDFLNGFDQTLATKLQDYVTNAGLNTRLSPIESAFKNLEVQEGLFATWKTMLADHENTLNSLGITLTEAEKKKFDDLSSWYDTQKDFIAGLPKNLGDFTEDDIKTLKDKMKDIKDMTNQVAGPTLDEIQYMIDQVLTGMQFYPMYYIGGIETIEVPVLAYQPIITKAGEKKGEHFEYSPNAIYGSLQTADGIAELDINELYNLELGSISPDNVSPWVLNGYFGLVSEVKNKTYTYMESTLTGNAYYHINPTTANLEGYDAKFLDHKAYAIEAIASPTEIQAQGGKYVLDPDYKKLTEADMLKSSGRYVASNYEKMDNGLLKVNIAFKDHKQFRDYILEVLNNADVMTIQNGDLQLNATAVKYQSNIDVVALQMTKDDKTVTSDYAAVCPAIYHVRHIVDVQPTETKTSAKDSKWAFAETMPKCDLTEAMKAWWAAEFKDMARVHEIRPLFMTAASCVADVPTHMVNYQKEFNVREWIRTHYTYIAPESTLREEFLHKQGNTIEEDDALLEKLGLHYEYHLVRYAEGQNVTEETNHLEHLNAAGESVASKDNIDPDPLSPIFIARSVDTRTGETIFGQPAIADRYTIDREPLIRVELKNTKGETIEAGYIKVIISEEEVVEKIPPVTVNHDFEGPYYVNCAELGDEMTWSEVENIILAAKDDEGNYILKNMTKNEFDEYYDADVNADGVFNRYTEADATKIDKNPFGEITMKIDPKEKETSVVRWEIGEPKITKDLKLFTNTDAGQKYLELANNEDNTLKQNGKALETYIRFVPKESAPGSYPVAYLKLTIPVKKINYAIGLVQNKVLDYWYKLNSGVGADRVNGVIVDDNETHMNVPTPKDQTTVLTTDDFKKDLYGFFYNPEKDNEKLSMDKRIEHNILDWKTDMEKFGELSKHGTFKLVEPNDQNSRVLYKNGWKVTGYSGDVYVLKVTDITTKEDGSTEQYITATKDGVTESIVSLIYTPDDPSTNATLDDNEETAVLQLLESEYGYDIMNKVGHTYLTEEDETFTAFIEVVNEEACYSFIENPYFNVRFLRPINWYPKEPNNLKDAWNEKQTIKLSEFVAFNDWRTTDNTNPDIANYTGKSYPVLEKLKNAIYEGEQTTYKYYGITIKSNDKECVTDLAMGKSERVKINGDDNINAAIAKGDLKKTYVFTDFDFTFDGTDTYTYYNNEGNLGNFHIYVPLYIMYTFSPWETEHLFIRTWSAVTVKETVNNPQTAKKN